eukprot:jgi/Tetstr1/439687/TSEL_028106.t1
MTHRRGVLAAGQRPAVLRLPVRVLSLVLLLGSTSAFVAGLESTLASDINALLSFKSALLSFDSASAIASWPNASSAAGQMPCQWQGVSCSPEGRVSGVSLPGGDGSILLGSLPSVLGHLEFLTELDLSGNELDGALPAEWAQLRRLRMLNIAENRATGGLPETWANMSGLAYLNVSSNRLAGGIPPELSALRNLTALDMSHNQFSGLLSGPALSSLSAGWSQLEILSISENRFSGPLPSEMSRFRSLHTLHMHANQLDGSIPGEWARGPLSAALSILDVSDNLLTGTLPDEWAQGMTRLAQVNARVNYLQGPLPDSWSSLPSLQSLDLSRNAINGPLPVHWGTWTSLLRLEITNNDITGPLPWVWGAMSQLESLVLNSNDLSGSLPPSWSGMKGMRSLHLQSNRLTGAIDGVSSWANMSNLAEMELNGNQLTGALPSGWSGFQSLTQMELQRNNLRGELPLSWGAGPIGAVLHHVDLSDNSVEGNLPASWSSMQRLTKLRLSENNLQGYVPDSWTAIESLIELDLDANPDMAGNAVPWQLAQALDVCPTCSQASAPDNSAEAGPRAVPERAAGQPLPADAGEPMPQVDNASDIDDYADAEAAEGSEVDSETESERTGFVYDSELHNEPIDDGEEALVDEKPLAVKQAAAMNGLTIGLVVGVTVGALILLAILAVCLSCVAIRHKRERAGRGQGAAQPRKSSTSITMAATPRKQRASGAKPQRGGAASGVVDVVVHLGSSSRGGTPRRSYQPPQHSSNPTTPRSAPRMSPLSPSMTPRTSHSGVLPVAAPVRGTSQLRTSLSYKPPMSTSSGLATPSYSPALTPRSSFAGPIPQPRLSSTGSTLMEPVMSMTPRVSETNGPQAVPPAGPEPSSNPGRGSFILRLNDLAKSRNTQDQPGLLPPGPSMSQEWTPSGLARYNATYSSKEGLFTSMEMRDSWGQSLTAAPPAREEQAMAALTANSQQQPQNLSVVPEASFEISAADLSFPTNNHSTIPYHPPGI